MLIFLGLSPVENEGKFRKTIKVFFVNVPKDKLDDVL